LTSFVEHLLSPTLSQPDMLSLQTTALGATTAGAMTMRRAMKALMRETMKFIVIFLMIEKLWSYKERFYWRVEIEY
jgi:hypothetical protein